MYKNLIRCVNVIKILLWNVFNSRLIPKIENILQVFIFNVRNFIKVTWIFKKIKKGIEN